MRDNTKKFSIKKYLTKYITIREKTDQKLSPKEFFIYAIISLMFLNCIAVLNMANPPENSLLLNCFYVMVGISILGLYIDYLIIYKDSDRENKLSLVILVIIGITLILGTVLFYLYYDTIMSKPDIFGSFNKVRK